MTDREEGGAIRRVMATLLDPTFAAMWVAMYFSTIGSSTLLLALAIRIYLETRSAFDASVIYAAQWLAPLVLAPLIVRAFGRMSPRVALLGCETVGIGLALAIGLAAPHGLLALLPLLVVRGVIDVAVKSGRLVALKATFSGDRLKSATSLNTTPYIIGLASAGLFASLLVDRFELRTIAMMSSACFAVAALAYGSLGGAAAVTPERGVAGRRPSLREQIAALDSEGRFVKRFALYTLVVATMQGYHTIARTVFPIEGLGLDASGPAWMQSVAISGVFAGSVLAAACVGMKRYEGMRVELVALAAYALMVATWGPVPTAAAFALYFLFMLVYEIAFLRLTADILAACPQEHAPSVSVAMTTASLGGMTLVTIAGGWAATLVGLWWTCAAIAAAGTVLLLAGTLIQGGQAPAGSVADAD